MKLEHPTLSQFVLEEEKRTGGTGQLSAVLVDLGVIGKVISREMNRAGLSSILGEADSGNASGDVVQKLDVLANDLFKEHLRGCAHVAAFASEEEEEIVVLDDSDEAHYVIAFDPLDGSSNIDFNVSVGTIFAVWKRLGGPVSEADFLQPGRELVAAGYILYGTSTMMVYSTGEGVHGFTLEQSIGEWLLSHKNVKIPAECNVYSANEAYDEGWSDVARQYLADFKREQPKAASRNIRSLVADVHRNLLKGGLLFRPYDNDAERKAKLRMVYELSPLAFIIEQAGGYATTGEGAVLDVVPGKLHEKQPFIAGNMKEARGYEARCIG